MKISKDEARILALALIEYQFDNQVYETRTGDAIIYLREKLKEFSKDKRFYSRHKGNDNHDLLKRYAKKVNKKNNSLN